MLSATERTRASLQKRMTLKNVVRKVFLDDWLLKLVALAITLGLWLGVTGLSTNSTKRLTVPLVPNVASNVKITNTLISEVDIVVSGDERKLRPLTGNNLVASVELSDVQPGERVVSLTPENVSVAELPLGVKLDEVQPRRIAVRLENVEEIELPVIADIEGKPANGFEIYGESVVSPARVRVRGPVSALRALQFASTEPVSVDGQSSDFVRRQVPVRIKADNMTISDTVVDVSVRVGELRIEKTVLVSVSGSAGRKAAVTLYGRRSVLNGIKPESLKVEMIRTDSGQETPQVNLPTELQDSVEVKRTRLLG